MIACDQGHTDVVRKLVDAGAHICQADEVATCTHLHMYIQYIPDVLYFYMYYATAMIL